MQPEMNAERGSSSQAMDKNESDSNYQLAFQLITHYKSEQSLKQRPEVRMTKFDIEFERIRNEVATRTDTV